MTHPPCKHPDPPEKCLLCDKEPVASINCVGACQKHLDDVFQEAAVPMSMLLMAATEAFGEGTEVSVDG
jgi:hypothetical protein